MQSPEALKGLRQIAVVESTESSNRLEGVVVAPSRLKSLIIRNATPKSRSEQEIAGYRDALALIHESATHMPFSEGVVLQLHTLLYRYMPQAGGRWKPVRKDGTWGGTTLSPGLITSGLPYCELTVSLSELLAQPRSFMCESSKLISFWFVSGFSRSQ